KGLHGCGPVRRVGGDGKGLACVHKGRGERALCLDVLRVLVIRCASDLANHPPRIALRIRRRAAGPAGSADGTYRLVKLLLKGIDVIGLDWNRSSHTPYNV